MKIKRILVGLAALGLMTGSGLFGEPQAWAGNATLMPVSGCTMHLNWTTTNTYSGSNIGRYNIGSQDGGTAVQAIIGVAATLNGPVAYTYGPQVTTGISYLTAYPAGSVFYAIGADWCNNVEHVRVIPGDNYAQT